MNRPAKPALEFTQRVIGIPYVLAEYAGETPQFVAQVLPTSMSPVVDTVHAEVNALLRLHRWPDNTKGQDDVGSLERAASARALLLAEAPLALRACARNIMRMHNVNRVYGERPTLYTKALAAFQFIPCREVIEATGEDPVRMISYLRVAGYVGAASTEAAMAASIPHDALAFLEIYPMPPLASQKERTNKALSQEIGVGPEGLRSLAIEHGRRRVVRQRPSSGYAEHEYYTAEDVADLRQYAAEKERSGSLEVVPASAPMSLHDIARCFKISVGQVREVLFGSPDALVAIARSGLDTTSIKDLLLPIDAQTQLAGAIMNMQRQITPSRSYSVVQIAFISGRPLPNVIGHLEGSGRLKAGSHANRALFSGVALDCILSELMEI